MLLTWKNTPNTSWFIAKKKNWNKTRNGWKNKQRFTYLHWKFRKLNKKREESQKNWNQRRRNTHGNFIRYIYFDFGRLPKGRNQNKIDVIHTVNVKEQGERLYDITNIYFRRNCISFLLVFVFLASMRWLVNKTFWHSKCLNIRNDMNQF